MSNKYEDWLINGGDYPGLDIDEVYLPQGFYVCAECGQVTDWWKPGMVCYHCEAKGERLQDER